MAIPSGSGTEVLKRVSGAVDGATTSVLTVGSNKICTVLSVIICNVNTSNACDVYMYARDGSDDREIFQLVAGATGALDKRATFVWNDKFVLTAGDILKIQEDGSGSIEYWVSYIEQDWS